MGITMIKMHIHRYDKVKMRPIFMYGHYMLMRIYKNIIWLDDLILIEISNKIWFVAKISFQRFLKCTSTMLYPLFMGHRLSATVITKSKYQSTLKHIEDAKFNHDIM